MLENKLTNMGDNAHGDTQVIKGLLLQEVPQSITYILIDLIHND
jgi:hypothetical protein